MINLKELKDSESANEEVLSINDIKILDNIELYGDKRFSEICGGLCGGKEGLLMEESLEILFNISSIYKVSENDKRYLLRQNGINYGVNKKILGVGTGERLEYVDFRNITEFLLPENKGE